MSKQHLKSIILAAFRAAGMGEHEANEALESILTEGETLSEHEATIRHAIQFMTD